MNYTVYKHTSPDGKVYIGITKVNPIKRWSYGRGYINNKHFYRAILKYGWDNIRHEILFSELTEEEAKSKEIELIEFYKSTNPLFGYNKTKGGDLRCHMSLESKEKMIKRLTGQRRTEEQRLHYKQAAAKRPKRLHLSEDHKKKISKSLVGNKRALGNRKKVQQYTLDWELVATFECAKFAAASIGCDPSGINRCCKENLGADPINTKYKGKYKGYRWKYE